MEANVESVPVEASPMEDGQPSVQSDGDKHLSQPQQQQPPAQPTVDQFGNPVNQTIYIKNLNERIRIPGIWVNFGIVG